MAGESDDKKRLERWMSLIRGPALIGRAEVVFPRRDQAIAEMRAAGAERLFLLLQPMLADGDAAVRFAACEAAFFIDAHRAIELVLPMLADSDSEIRWFVCGCMHYCRDERAIDPLIRILQTDLQAQVRSAAAHSLGRIGSPAAIPALLAALSDNEADMHGHTVSFQAAAALDDILGTSETRTKLESGDSIRRADPPNLDLLRRLGTERYEQWSSGSENPVAAPDRSQK